MSAEEPKKEEAPQLKVEKEPKLNEKPQPEVKPESKEVKPAEEKQTNCLGCGKPLQRLKRYYRDRKFYCNKECWRKFKETQEKVAKETQTPQAKEKETKEKKEEKK